jgi:hypothetical protein
MLGCDRSKLCIQSCTKSYYVFVSAALKESEELPQQSTTIQATGGRQLGTIQTNLTDFNSTVSASDRP